ncbi:hypothetical protein WDJ51_04250 [Rathayibacter sp. YIM 133350]|uniref:hypothetical protein n=1 Tax=Rathayibacter sp. YIM 133350 TaxID=3131992 RepID=UPI00307E6243
MSDQIFAQLPLEELLALNLQVGVGASELVRPSLEKEHNRMDSEEDALRRVRFYGPNDLAAGWHAPRVVELVNAFDPSHAPTSIVDVLELHNVQQYLEHGLVPTSCTNEELDQLSTKIPQLRSVVARFFASVDNSNFATIVTEVDHNYHEDLIHLLGRSRAFERCDSSVVLPALKAAGVHLRQMLASEILVKAYDSELRGELLASARGAEYLASKYLEKERGGAIYLPPSFTPADARNLFARYIDSDEANLNYVRLISMSRDHSGAGIDAKLKLQAMRRAESLNAELFEHNDGFKTGCEVGISDDQDEPVAFEVDSSDGTVWRYTYSKRWLDETADNPSILNNFVHLFEFVDRQMLLTFPAYSAQFGVIERMMGVTGNAEYKVSTAFRNLDARSKLQTLMYLRYLESQDVELEGVISWFFESYLVEEFGMSNFSFVPSDVGTPYLHRVRHLFAEMESIANQFGLFVENGELDRDLLTMAADPVRYKAIPSLLDGKYLYATASEEIAAVLHLLFSDQSRLNYIHAGLRDENAAGLILRNDVAYSDFHDHQKGSIDHLIDLGVLEAVGHRLRFVSNEQLLILAALFNTEAVQYFHLSEAGRMQAESMVGRGWLTRRSSLLTDAEAEYFNYFLNRAGFSNGPNLRNAYLHGTQRFADEDQAHADTYLIALRLTVALVIKMNDDLCLSAIGQSA